MLGNNIKELRKQKHLIQKDLAKLMHVSQQTIGAWETERAIPGSDTLALLTNLFNVSTDYLLGHDPKKDDLKTADKNVQLITAHIDDGTTPEEMERIIDYIDYVKSKREKK